MKISPSLRYVIRALILVLFFLLIFPTNANSQTIPGEQVYLPFVASPSGATPSSGPGSCLSAQEVELGRLINEYRAANGLPAAPYSKSLTMVAQYHVQDMQENYPSGNFGVDSRGITCNLHTWSSKGFWSPVCYTGDHKYAEGMWNKPREITRGIYTDYGYEIASAQWGKDITAQTALNLWKTSPDHNDVILEQDIWKGKKWPAMGIGISKNYAVVWFSNTTDPQGSVTQCP